MRIVFSGLLAALFFLVFSQTSYATTSLEVLAQKAISKRTSESSRAIAELRSMGPAGLDALIRSHAAEIDRYTNEPLTPPTANWLRLSSAIDSVSQQKDSYLSGLYWYTDLAQARAEARATGKPILSLRLLGRLGEEYSCANSRFFRAILYSSAEVSALLRERFVLHWQSVRPAPRVTIDFGDGRKLERTLTGNSIHYIIDSEGRVIDALPGLYGPAAFRRALNDARDTFVKLHSLNNSARTRVLEDYHRGSIRRITSDWLADLRNVGGKVPAHLIRQSPNPDSPRALEAAPLAVTKMVTEVSILRAITRDAEALGAVTDDEAWTSIARLHIEDARLDNRSLGLIQRQLREVLATNAAEGINLSKLIETLQLSVALDTVRNDYMLRTKLHSWLTVDPARNNLEAFNEKVYRELFLTPRSDPWLGLFSPETYVALENGGLSR